MLRLNPYFRWCVGLGLMLALCGGASMAQPLYQYQPPSPPPGVQVPPPQMQTVPAVPTRNLWEVCALEEEICRIRRPALVRYGINGRYVERTVKHSFFCTNDLFPDPAPGMRKQCEIHIEEHHHRHNWQDNSPRYDGRY